MLSVLAMMTPLAFGADRPAHYHPDDVARASRAFQSVGAVIGPGFEEAQRQVTGATDGLARMELALGLLGDTAPPMLTRWIQDARKDLTGQALAVQRHADVLTERSSQAFGAALERALPVASKGFVVKTCAASGVAAMMGRTQCAGESLNDALAGAMDRDPALKGAAAAILSTPWPKLTAPDTPLPAAPLAPGRGTSGGWIDGARVAEALAGPRLEALRARTRAAAEVAAENEDPAGARRAREAWLAGLAADGAVLREEIAGALARAKGLPPELGWCVNPARFGGCTGTDRTEAALEALRADKRLTKALAKRLPPPEQP